MFKKVMILIFLAIIVVFGFDLVAFKNLKDLQELQKIPQIRTPVFSFGRSLPSPKTTIILTGDIMLGRSVMTVSLSKNNPSYPFEKVSGTLKEADLVFGNMENPIISNCPASDSGLLFCADPKMVEGLKGSNVDIVSLANNHTRNYGEAGLSETENYLTRAGIDFVGVNNLVIKRVNATNFGFLGFDFVDKKPTSSDYQLIRDSKRKVDILIVMVHWGAEYASEPSESQKSLAKDLVAWGADIVTGSHPHRAQSIDYIDGKPVFYSLGNFVFDQPWSEETKKGLAIRLTYQDNKLSKVEELPIYMKTLAQPDWSE